MRSALGSFLAPPNIFYNNPLNLALLFLWFPCSYHTPILFLFLPSHARTDDGVPLTIHKNVTVGHMVMLHGCEIGEGSLIGIGRCVLSAAAKCLN